MASTRQYPKYVRVTETTLGYQRSIPKRYAHLTKKRLWSYPLGLSPSASDATIYASVIKAEESYQLFLKRLESTDPSAYTDTEIDRLAEEILRKRSLKPGLFNKVSDELGELAPDDLADIVLPEVEDIRFKRISNADHQHDITELAFLRAHKVLQERQTNRPKTLEGLWNAYLTHRGVDLGTRDGQRTQMRWDKLRLFLNDALVTPESPNQIEEALDAFTADAESRGVKNATIERYLKEPIACFRWANRKYRLQWRPIELAPLAKQPSKSRLPLSLEDQRILVASCIEQPDWVSAALLLMLQGGCMASEIARLRPSLDLNLDAETPHIIISGGEAGITKQESRKRIVPIVIGLDVLKKSLPLAVEKLAQVKEPSTLPNQRIKQQVGKQYSGHSLRHTIRANGVRVGADAQAMYIICGWNGASLNPIMLNYGASGLGSSEIIKKLYRESLKIHGHLEF